MATWIHAGLPRNVVRFPPGARDWCFLKKGRFGFWSQPASYSMGIGCHFLCIKQMGRVVDLSSQSSAEIENDESHSSISPIRIRVLCRDSFVCLWSETVTVIYLERNFQPLLYRPRSLFIVYASNGRHWDSWARWIHTTVKIFLSEVLRVKCQLAF
jgi:hypothetical protein